MRLVAATVLLFGGLATSAQPQVSVSAFEVASVKPAGSAAVKPGRLPPGEWRAFSSTLVSLIGRAYPQFAFEQLVVGGPQWVRQAEFDITAKMAPTTPATQVAEMVSTLLADRFELRFHKDQRLVDVYVLRMSRPDGQMGPQLKRTDSSCEEARIARSPLPVQCQATAKGGLQMVALQISDLVRVLSALGIERPVSDRTGLSGYFDLQLSYDYFPSARVSSRSQNAPDAVSFFTALQEQAGLKLEVAREMMDVIVIDSAKLPLPD